MSNSILVASDLESCARQLSEILRGLTTGSQAEALTLAIDIVDREAVNMRLRAATRFDRAPEDLARERQEAELPPMREGDQ